MNTNSLKSIFLFFMALFVPILCQSKLVETPSAYTNNLLHTNGKLCWKDPKVYSNTWGPNDSGAVHYSNGQLCWKDPKVYSNTWGPNDSGIVYHSNGKPCWKDPKVYNNGWGPNDSGIVYYSNGKLCWKDPKVYNNTWGTNDSGAVYYSNGQLCWKDPIVYKNSWGANDSGILYHANGQVCWKDPEIYSDGGKCFDSAGKRMDLQGLGNSISVELGKDSRANISANGQLKLSIDMGDENYFVRSYDSTVTLIKNLGSALSLYLPCLESSNESIWIFDKSNNWMMISE